MCVCDFGGAEAELGSIALPRAGSALRAAFFDVFHRSVGRTPAARLQFLIGTQDDPEEEEQPDWLSDNSELPTAFEVTREVADALAAELNLR